MSRLRLGAVLASVLLLSAPSAFGQNVPAAGLVPGQSVSGELSPNDSQRRSGKNEDVFSVQGRRGGRIDLRLGSEDFDSFLVVTGPEGFSLSNDDERSESLDSRLVLEFPADGVYRVSVTTFRPGETGRYRLQASQPAAGVAVTAPERAEPITIGATVNGSLAPGEANHHHIADLRGTWERASVQGRMIDRGWGARKGYPGLELSRDGDDVPVMLFASDDLPRAWARLDAFEGRDYCRVLATVLREGTVTVANVYELRRA